MLFSRRLSLAAHLWGTAGLGASLVTLLATPAQSQLPACPPPASQEYLLLVRGETEADRNKIAAILPTANTVLVCSYLNEPLVRAGGFTSLETANAWAAYMTTVEGYESFVSRPADNQTASSQTASSQTATQSAAQSGSQTTAANSIGYQPQRLAPGYAVLVNYGSQPEIAETVGQLMRPVGLAVYRQQAYLLAEYTSDAATAAATVQRLTNARLNAVLVDSQEVVRLSPEVAR